MQSKTTPLVPRVYRMDGHPLCRKQHHMDMCKGCCYGKPAMDILSYETSPINHRHRTSWSNKYEVNEFAWKVSDECKTWQWLCKFLVWFSRLMFLGWFKISISNGSCLFVITCRLIKRLLSLPIKVLTRLILNWSQVISLNREPLVQYITRTYLYT